MKKEPRLIKKYPNRRLYDTDVSRYITLEEVKELVLNSDDFIVIDKKTGKDITRSILLQVISEQEEGADPMFTKDYLRQVIRFYGDSVQSSVSNYLEHSLDYFIEQRQQVQDRLRDIVDQNPISRLREMAREDGQNALKKIKDEVMDNVEHIVGRGDAEENDKKESSKADKANKDGKKEATKKK